MDLSAHKPEGPPRAPGVRAVRPRSAATLMIIRRDAAGTRVLMGRRHGGHAFMPNRWVFPGGRLEVGDHRAPAGSELRPDVLAVFDRHLSPGGGRAVALAAIRETWEECGLLLARPGSPRGARGPWAGFLAQGMAPDLDAVDLVARAITPPMIGRRFDTWFLTADAARLATLDRQPDCGELDEIAWVGFDEADALPLPLITRLMLKEAALRLDDPSRPRPFLRHRAGAMSSVPL